MDELTGDMDKFLQTIHSLEQRIEVLIQNSKLTDAEKKFILNHIIVVPGKDKTGS